MIGLWSAAYRKLPPVIREELKVVMDYYRKGASSPYLYKDNIRDAIKERMQMIIRLEGKKTDFDEILLAVHYATKYQELRREVRYVMEKVRPSIPISIVLRDESNIDIICNGLEKCGFGKNNISPVTQLLEVYRGIRMSGRSVPKWRSPGYQ